MMDNLFAITRKIVNCSIPSHGTYEGGLFVAGEGGSIVVRTFQYCIHQKSSKGLLHRTECLVHR